MAPPGSSSGRALTGRVAIVIPVLNEAARIERTLVELASCLDDVVVVDGGSVDRSVAIALDIGVRVVRSPMGRALQMNAGAAACIDASVLLFLHADVRLPVGWREAMVQAVADGAKWGRFDVALESVRPDLRLVSAMMNLRSRLTGIATGDQAIFMTREAWVRTGGWPAVPLMEDIRMSSLLLRRVGRPACLSTTVRVSARRWETAGVWPTIALMWRLRALHSLGVSPVTLHRMYYGAAAGERSASSPDRVIVFAKVPRVGEVKTRLAATMGEAVALATHRALLEYTLAQAAAVPARAHELCLSGGDHEGECAELARRFGFAVTAQVGDDLGERMANAMRPAIERGERVVLLGTDCPVIRAADIADGLATLQGPERVDAVFAPTEDGGYVLVGAVGAIPPVFDAMRWSHSDVMAQTIQRMQCAGLRHQLLRTLWDVDDAAGWVRWRALQDSPAAQGTRRSCTTSERPHLHQAASRSRST